MAGNQLNLEPDGWQDKDRLLQVLQVQRVVWLRSVFFSSLLLRGQRRVCQGVGVTLGGHLGVCPLTCPLPQWMLGSVKHLLKCSSWACSLSLSSLTFCLWLTSSWQMKDGHDSHYRSETFCTQLHRLQTAVPVEKQDESTRACRCGLRYLPPWWERAALLFWSDCNSVLQVFYTDREEPASLYSTLCRNR